MAQLTVETGREGSWLEKTIAVLPALRAQVEPAGAVTVVLPPHLTLMKMLNTPRIEAGKCDKIINFESQQSIPYPLTDVVWDRMAAGESGHGFGVLLCAAKLDVLDPLCAAVAEAGLAPSVLLPSAPALVASYRQAQPEPAGPTMLINLGARSTTLVLMDENRFQARSLLLGGNSVTQQIAEGKACDSGCGEEIKPSVRHEEEISSAVRVFANRLAQEITRTLVYFRRPISAESPLRLMLTGGAARLPGLNGLLAAQLQLPVSTFDAAGAIELGREADGFNREADGPALADAIGAATLQLGVRQPSLNLLPPRLRRQARRRRLRPWLAVAAGLAVAGVFVGVAHQRQVLAGTRERSTALERELGPLRAEAARSQAIRQRAEDARRRQDAWQKIEAARADWLRFLAGLQAKFVLSGDVWLDRMQLEPLPSGHDPGCSPAGRPLRLACSGLMRQPPEADPNAGGAAYQRVRRLLESLGDDASVGAVENERFETTPAGLLRFDFVVVLKASATP